MALKEDELNKNAKRNVPGLTAQSARGATAIAPANANTSGGPGDLSEPAPGTIGRAASYLGSTAKGLNNAFGSMTVGPVVDIARGAAALATGNQPGSNSGGFFATTKAYNEAAAQNEREVFGDQGAGGLIQAAGGALTGTKPISATLAAAPAAVAPAARAAPSAAAPVAPSAAAPMTPAGAAPVSGAQAQPQLSQIFSTMRNGVKSFSDQPSGGKAYTPPNNLTAISPNEFNSLQTTGENSGAPQIKPVMTDTEISALRNGAGGSQIGNFAYALDNKAAQAGGGATIGDAGRYLQAGSDNAGSSARIQQSQDLAASTAAENQIAERNALNDAARNARIDVGRLSVVPGSRLQQTLATRALDMSQLAAQANGKPPDKDFITSPEEQTNMDTQRQRANTERLEANNRGQLQVAQAQGQQLENSGVQEKQSLLAKYATAQPLDQQSIVRQLMLNSGRNPETAEYDFKTVGGGVNEQGFAQPQSVAVLNNRTGEVSIRGGSDTASAKGPTNVPEGSIATDGNGNKRIFKGGQWQAVTNGG